MPRIAESDLIIPALIAMYNSNNRTISTTELIEVLTNELNPTGEDLEILNGRNDTKFSQKVRNLKSHNTMVGLANYTPPAFNGESGTFTITEEGINYIAQYIN